MVRLWNILRLRGQFDPTLKYFQKLSSATMEFAVGSLFISVTYPKGIFQAFKTILYRNKKQTVIREPLKKVKKTYIFFTLRSL